MKDKISLILLVFTIAICNGQDSSLHNIVKDSSLLMISDWILSDSGQGIFVFNKVEKLVTHENAIIPKSKEFRIKFNEDYVFSTSFEKVVGFQIHGGHSKGNWKLYKHNKVQLNDVLSNSILGDGNFEIVLLTNQYLILKKI